MNLEVGDILFVRGNSWPISPLVKMLLKSEYSHMAIVTGPGEIAEIDFMKKLSIHPNKHKNYTVYRYKDGLTEDQKIGIKKFIEERILISKGYDWLRIIEILIRLLTNWEGVMDSANREICFEVIDLAYKSIGIDLTPIGDHPEDILKSPLLVAV